MRTLLVLVLVVGALLARPAAAYPVDTINGIGVIWPFRATVTTFSVSPPGAPDLGCCDYRLADGDTVTGYVELLDAGDAGGFRDLIATAAFDVPGGGSV